MMKLIFFTVLFLTVTSLYAQKDSIIYFNNDNTQKYPYKNLLKKYLKKRNKKVIPGQDVETLPRCHNLYFVENRDTLPLDTAMKIYNKKLGDNYQIFFQVKVDWQSIIREIVVLSVIGNPDLNKFREFCNGIIAKPLYRFGLPVESKCAMAIKNE